MRLNIENIAAISVAACLSIAGTAFAGSGNEAFVLQETTPGAAEGNSLRIDQSAASNSTVAGVDRVDLTPDDENTISFTGGDGNPLVAADSEFTSQDGSLITFAPGSDGAATQSGSGNSTRIVATGSNTEVGLFQDGTDNRGTITAGSGTALLFQEGVDNEGTVTTSDGAMRASLLQDGDENSGTVIVSGARTEGNLAQIGNGNETELNVTTDGAAVDFTVVGNGTSATVPASVVTNAGGGQITIIQRPLQ